MRETRRYFEYFQRNWWLIIGGLGFGLILGIVITLSGGKEVSSGVSLELTADEAHIRERMLVNESAVVWAREVSVERGWVNPEYKLAIYKTGPVTMRVEITGAGSEAMVERVGSELTAKYGFGRLTEIQSTEKSKVSEIYVVVLGLIGLGAGLVISLIRSYWRNY